MNDTVRAYVKLRMRRQKLLFRLENTILRDRAESLRRHGKGVRKNA